MKRFAYLRDPLFLVACALYATNCWLLKPLVKVAFLRSHFNDLLLMPAALPLALYLQRWLGLRTHDLAPTWGEMLTHLALWSLICELVGPLWLHCGTADPVDVLVYALGGAVSSIWWNWRFQIARAYQS